MTPRHNTLVPEENKENGPLLRKEQIEATIPIEKHRINQHLYKCVYKQEESKIKVLIVGTRENISK